MLYSLSDLEEEQLEDIKSLEQKLGRTLLAFSGHDVKPASLQEEEIKRIKELEDKLGMVLVAVEDSNGKGKRA